MSGGPGVRILVVGDSGPFSAAGKGTSFLVSAGDSPGFLIDCGSPPFASLGRGRLESLLGVVCTHSHEDHKRWLTDIALHFRYAARPPRRLNVLATETVHEELRATSVAALERTLADDLLSVVDVPYEEFVERTLIGPQARYRIERRRLDGSDGWVWRVVDPSGAEAPPGKAKVVVNPDGGRPRMLFFDEQYSEWIEPENFYSFGAPAFYEGERREARDPATGLTIEPIKCAAWHGPPTVSIIVEVPGGTRVAFSSDVRFDPPLWRRLCEEKRLMRMEMSAKEFDRAHLIFGDINRYVERTWSYERYRGAVSAFDDCVVFHDADVAGTVVHTPSANLEAAPGGPEGRWRALVLAHTPDRFVSRLPMTATGRVFDVLGGEVREVTASGEIAPLAADVYAKSGDRHYAGRLDEKGAHSLWKGPGDYRLTPALPDPPGARSEPPLDESKHELVGKVRLCRDLGGRYVPVSASPREHFRVRADGRIEVIDERPGGSTCRIVEDERGRA